MRSPAAVLAALVATALPFAPTPAIGIDFFWTGSASGSWTDPNWSLDPSGTPPAPTLPGSSADIVFSAASAANSDTVLGANFEVHSLSIASSSAVSIGGMHTLTISGAGDGPGIALLPGAGNLTLDANLQFGGSAGLVTMAQGTTATIHGVIGGGVDLRKEGAGNLTITSASAYTGETVVHNGALIVQGGSVGRLEKDVVIGRESGNSGSLTVVSAGAVLSDFAKIGDAAGSTGTVHLDGGALSSRVTLLVGNVGTGTLSLANGSVSTENTFIGTQVGSTGSVTVSGGTFASSNDIVVGSEGTGTLVLEGGVVTVGGGSGTVMIAEMPGSTGTLRIGNGGSFGTLNASVVTAGGGVAAVHFDHNSDIVFAPNLTGAITVTKSGQGSTTFATAKSYSGATHIQEGRLIVNGSLASPSITVAAAGTLAGSGTLAGTITLSGTLSPGAPTGIGVLSTGSQTWLGGGELVWEIANAGGAAGTDWDRVAVTGTLSISATTDNPFVLSLATLANGGIAGLAENFDPSADHEWTIVTTTGGIAGFDAGKFAIDPSDVENELDGVFSISLDGANLTLVYTAVPEPSTIALVALGSLFLSRRLRRSM